MGNITAEFLYSHVKIVGDCWLWQRHKDKKGYGRLYIGGRLEGVTSKTTGAHRASHLLSVGPIPEGHKVCHTCDNPSCINPKHLFAGTDSDNMKDMHAKGRHDNGNASKTHCKHGHEFSPENTRLYKGMRTCRTCARLYQRQYKRLNK